MNIPSHTQQTFALLYLSSGQGSRTRDVKPTWNQFPYWTFSYCLNGQGKIDFQETGESFFSHKDHVSVVPANCMHRGAVISKNSGIYHWIHVQFEVLGFQDPLAYLNMPHVLPKNISQEILDIGRNIFQITKNEKLSTVDTVINLNYQGIHLLKLLSDNFKWNCFPAPSQRQLKTLTPVREAMKLNLGKHMDIEAFARSVSMSRSSFHRHFKQTFGITPYAYVEKLRMREAVNLLCRNNIPIDELAENLGYCDRFQFSKIFKRFYRQSPAQYRKNYYSLFNKGDF